MGHYARRALTAEIPPRAGTLTERWPRRSPAHWHDQRSEETLSDAENDERGEAAGEPARQRAYREAADGAKHDTPPAEPARQPTGRWGRNGGGNQIQCDDPGDLIVGRRKRASDLWKDDIGQGARHAEKQARQLHG